MQWIHDSISYFGELVKTQQEKIATIKQTLANLNKNIKSMETETGIHLLSEWGLFDEVDIDSWTKEIL